MPALRLIRKNTDPPGGWFYVHAETGWTTKGGHFDALIRNAVEYRQANHLPVGTNFEGDVEQQICERAGSEWCEGGAPRFGGLTKRALLQATAVLIDWALSGRERVSNEEADRRGAICAPCPNNQGGESCKTCTGDAMASLVAKLVVDGPVPHDRLLRNCSVCGCSLVAKTRIPIEILHRHLPDDQQNAFPDFCWVKKPELKAVA